MSGGRKIFLFLGAAILLFAAADPCCRAQNAWVIPASSFEDSVFYRPGQAQCWREIATVSAPLMFTGYLITPGKEAVQDLRHHLLRGTANGAPEVPGRRTRVDDYLQYAPAALLLGLKLSGYRGRSSWGRMLVADAFSVALMAGLTNGFKYGVKEERPDGADRHSFPSGHTATAFMAATLLHKEYGQTRSVWFSAGGYAAATTVGILRIVNNKHWVNDVLFGAGLGIFSAETGYYLADLIFKEKGLRYELKPWAQSEVWADATGFVALNLGARVPLGSDGSNGAASPYKTGAFTGVEGGCFLHPHWGLGAEINASEYQYTAHANAYFRVNLHPAVTFGVKAGAGYSYLPCEKIHAAGMGAGMSLSWRLAPRFAFKIYSDYCLTVSPQIRCHSLMAGGSACFLIP